MRKKVVLPQPLGPTNEMNSDGWTSKEMLSKTWIGSSDLWLRKLLRKLRTTSLDPEVSIRAGSRSRSFSSLYITMTGPVKRRFCSDHKIVQAVQNVQPQGSVQNV
jgi:hypothetical protein